MNKKFYIFFICLVLVLIGALIIFKGDKKESAKNNENKDINLLTGKLYVEINIKRYGKIKLELDADQAPITVTNFINLVNNGFYDGLTFHRIIDGFMIQGGAFKEDGSVKQSSNIKGEFLANSVNNTIKHERGVISMARGDDYNSASSQFFIVQQSSPHLDGYYAAFGHVIDGINVVDKISKDAKPTDNNGSIKIQNRPVIDYIKVVNNEN